MSLDVFCQTINIDYGKDFSIQKKTPVEKHKGKTFCRSEFYKWKVITEKKFDVKQGKLVTAYSM